MSELKIEYLIVFAGFVLPGAISIYVYSLIVPQRDVQLKDKIAESVCFSILNFVIMIIPITWALELGFSDDTYLLTYLLLILSFVVAPGVWPRVLVLFLRFAEDRRTILPRSRTAWDHYFASLRDGIWVQAVLQDGSVVGGVFGRDSFASSYPEPGHIYIQELWQIDAQGHFASPMNGSPGILLRPDDYRYLKVF